MRTKSKILFMALLTMSLTSFAETNNNQGFEKNGMEMTQNQKKLSKEDFYAKLNLNGDQKKKMEVILNDFDESMRKNKLEKGSEPPKNGMDNMKKELNTKVKAILDSKQYGIYEKNIDSYLLPPGPPPQDKQ